MGRHDSDPSMVNSSIALLQERFRQLEKVKERREEKEFLKLFSETQRGSSAMHFQASENFTQQKLVLVPHRYSTLHGSLGLNLTDKQGDINTIRTPTSSTLQLELASTSSLSRNFENSDVDTSLHL